MAKLYQNINEVNLMPCYCYIWSGCLESNQLLARQNTPGIENDDSGATTNLPQQTTPAAIVATQVPDPNAEFKVACLVILISLGGILSVHAALSREEKTEITHNVLFKAYTVLNYISLVVSVALFVLCIKRSNTPGLDKIIKFTLWISLGSITYALACATSIILADNLVEVILVLLAPLVMVFLLIILSFCGRKKA